MDNALATTRVREFLCRQIEITPCLTPPENVSLYDFNPAKEFLFTFKLFGRETVGADEYVAVDRESGEVRYLGFCGE
jgi:hypothetical protein